MTVIKTCGNCMNLIVSEGKPYWCCIRPMYVFRDKHDKACDNFIRKDIRNQ